MLHAAAPKFSSFFALRFLLGTFNFRLLFQLTHERIGMCESCVTPILILIVSMFYKKSEQVSGEKVHYINNANVIRNIGQPNFLVLRNGWIPQF